MENDILMLFEGFQLSESTACCQKSRKDRIVALCILLKRLSNPYRSKDIVPIFGRNPAEPCLIFVFDVIYQRHHHRLESWNLCFLQPPYLQRYADAVARKGAPLYNCFGFVDGTIARIHRPVLNDNYSPTQGYMV